MKLRVIIYSVLALFVFMACNDELSPIGSEIQLGKDKLSVQTDTIPFSSSTQTLGPIFAKSSSALLGSFYDPTYGEVQYGYLCNFYTAPSDVFGKVIDEKVDSVILKLTYSHLFGDPLTTMEASVYGISKGKTLEKYFYSDIDPWQYTSKDSLWARKSYTARNLNVPDSVYNKSGYTSTLSFRLPTSAGQRIYNEWKTDTGKKTFEDLDEFFKFFPGIYVESSYGSGNILKILKSDIEVYYHTDGKNEQGKDIIVAKYALFTASKEVTQLNKFKSKESDDLLLLNTDTVTFLKTPAGVVTQLEINLEEIKKKIGDNRTFNNVRLSLEVKDQKSEQYTLIIPPRVLLISSDPDSVKTFFEETRRAVDGISRYSASLTTSSAYKYDFGNISNIIEQSIKKHPPKDYPLLKLWVIPIDDRDLNISGITHYFEPSGAILKNKDLKLIITTSKRND